MFVCACKKILGNESWEKFLWILQLSSHSWSLKFNALPALEHQNPICFAPTPEGTRSLKFNALPAMKQNYVSHLGQKGPIRWTGCFLARWTVSHFGLLVSNQESGDALWRDRSRAGISSIFLLSPSNLHVSYNVFMLDDNNMQVHKKIAQHMTERKEYN